MKHNPDNGCQSYIQQHALRHSGAGRNPGFRSTVWIPACAGMAEHSNASTREMNSLAPNEAHP